MKKMYKMIVVAIVMIISGMSANAQMSKEELKSMIAEMNQMCPADLGDGMEFTSIKIVDNDIVMKLTCDEDNATIDMIAQMADYIAPQFAESLTYSPDTAELINVCKANKLNLKVVMANRTGHSATLMIKYTNM